MNFEFQVFDTFQVCKSKAKIAIVEKINEEKIKFGTDGFTGTLAEADASKIIFASAEFDSIDNAIVFLREHAKTNVMLVKTKKTILTKKQALKISTITAKKKAKIESINALAIAYQEDLNSCKADILFKMKSLKKRQLCLHCGSLIPPLHLESLTCPVCSQENAFLTPYCINRIDIRLKKFEAAKKAHKLLIQQRDNLIESIKAEDQQTQTTWFAGCHCPV